MNLHERPDSELKRRRSSLSHQGGASASRGEARWADELSAVLAASDTEETRDLTHGFHTYPARMHPGLARELIARFASRGQMVLDPFCGSGTMPIEALVAGCKPQGVDLNPLALRISEVQCALRNPAASRRFARAARAVAQASEERVRARERVRIELPREVSDQYQPHVLFEMCGLRDEIEAVPHEGDRRALRIVFSTLLVKFSRRRADTSAEVAEKRIRKGLVTEFFLRKADELLQRWEALSEAAPHDAFEARLMLGDARELPALLGSRFRADLVVTSPPYGGTYDYARHHALRAAWFGLSQEELSQREVGARRFLSRNPRGRARWDDELSAVLRSLRGVVADTAHVLLWIGDAEIDGVRVDAAQQLAQLAPAAGLRLIASAAQTRPDARRGPPRSEHLILLSPAEQLSRVRGERRALGPSFERARSD